jgi:glycosyltransferase involved in cell wall biosynthesis
LSKHAAAAAAHSDEASTGTGGEASNGDIDVSVVMPCLDEEGSVGQCVGRARKWIEQSGLRGEVIVVDNGSTDRSVELAKRAGARVEREDARGYGRAIMRGLADARGRIVVMGDADGTYDFSDLSPLIAQLDAGADIVIGNRFAGGVAPGAMPFLHRYVGTPINNALLRAFFGVRVGDSHSGLRAFRRDILGSLRLSEAGFELTAEMIIQAARAGYRIAEVPARYGARQGQSKLSTVREGWRFLRFVLLAAPDFLFVLPGAALLAVGLLVFALSFLSPSGVEVGSLSWQPVFAGPIFVIIGVNALAFGVIAKLRGAARGLLPDDRAVRLYRRFFRLEVVLALAAALAFAGVALDGYLFMVWAGGGHLLAGNHLAALAQTLLIVGAQLGFAAFLLVTVDSE